MRFTQAGIEIEVSSEKLEKAPLRIAIPKVNRFDGLL
jgi:hypothetical protein